jgi:hypothetical protein
MINELKNNICRCGHHHFAKWDYCSGCHINTIHKYIPKDNLEYLEKLYEEKTTKSKKRIRTR